MVLRERPRPPRPRPRPLPREAARPRPRARPRPLALGVRPVAEPERAVGGAIAVTLEGGAMRSFEIIRPVTARGAKGSSTIHTSVYYVQLRNTEIDQSGFFMYYLLLRNTKNDQSGNTDTCVI